MNYSKSRTASSSRKTVRFAVRDAEHVRSIKTLLRQHQRRRQQLVGTGNFVACTVSDAANAACVVKCC